MQKFYRLIIIAALLITAHADNLFALGKLQGYVEKGGQSFLTSITGASSKGQISYPAASVTVYLAGTNTLATIYNDTALTAKANPFAADSVGYWFFYAADGDYDVQFSGGGITIPFTRSGFHIGGGCQFGVICANTLATGGDGSSGSPWTGWESRLNALPANSAVHFSAGYYTQTTKISMKPGWVITGDGNGTFNTSVGVSVITSSFTGGAFEWLGTAQANGGDGSIKISSLAIINTNNANNSSGVLVKDSQSFHMDGVLIRGFKFQFTNLGVTHWSIKRCAFYGTAATKICLWVSNGTDYKPPFTDQDLSLGFGGSGYSYSNDDSSVTDCQFAQIIGGGAALVVVESTFAFTLDSCKMIGGDYAVWLAGQDVSVRLSGCTYENQQQQMIAASGTLFMSGTAAGFHGGIVITNNIGTAAAAGSHFINCTVRVDNLVMSGNSFAGTATMIGGAANLNFLTAHGNNSSTSNFTDGNPNSGTIDQPVFTSFNGVNVNDGNLQIKSQQVTSFVIELKRNAGVIQHRIISDGLSAGATNMATKISGASSAFNNTPQVSNVVGFTAGAGIDASATSRIVFNTGDQSLGDLLGIGTIEDFSVHAGTTIPTGVRIIPYSINVNGITRTYFAISVIGFATSTPTVSSFTNALAFTTASAFQADGEFVRIRLFEYVK